MHKRSRLSQEKFERKMNRLEVSDLSITFSPSVNISLDGAEYRMLCRDVNEALELVCHSSFSFSHSLLVCVCVSLPVCLSISLSLSISLF